MEGRKLGAFGKTHIGFLHCIPNTMSKYAVPVKESSLDSIVGGVQVVHWR